METEYSRNGTSLIDLIISLGIVVLLFVGVYLVYFSIETALANVSVRSAASATVANEIEMIRGLPYGSVGTVGGIPSGIIPQTQNVSYGGFSFILQTTVLNIDDPYDAAPSSSPVADYKLVDITATCPLCTNFGSIEITTTVASRTLAAGTPYGSIFVTALNADGVGVPGATVQVVNASVTPSVDVIDTTDASGVLELIGVPTSTQGYQVFVSKSGYSSAQTYPPGGAGNPNPIQPNITVASETVSSVTLSIDALSTITVSTTDNMCNPIGNESIAIQGTRVIGSSPTIYQFSTSTETNASGSLLLPNLAWDTYTFTVNDSSRDIAGIMPGDPLAVNPGSTQSLQFILAPAANPALLVGVNDSANGVGIAQAAVTLSKGAFSQTLTTDHAMFSQSDWSVNGDYTSSDGGIATSTPGSLSLVANASGTYATSTVDWLISPTFNVGGTSSTFNAISWNPVSEPANTSLSFQVAANDDNATWNFVGPDGTANTYFTSPSSLPSSLAGDQYFRYEVFMGTQNATATPLLTNISFDFTANCVPPAQVLFAGLSQGNYTLDVSAPNYEENSTTISVGAGFQSSTMMLTQL